MSSQSLGVPWPGWVLTVIHHWCSSPSSWVHSTLQPTEQAWQPMHLLRSKTMAICSHVAGLRLHHVTSSSVSSAQDSIGQRQPLGGGRTDAGSFFVGSVPHGDAEAAAVAQVVDAGGSSTTAHRPSSSAAEVPTRRRLLWAEATRAVATTGDALVRRRTARTRGSPPRPRYRWSLPAHRRRRGSRPRPRRGTPRWADRSRPTRAAPRPWMPSCAAATVDLADVAVAADRPT